jgi:hypothetical protein
VVSSAGSQTGMVSGAAAARTMRRRRRPGRKKGEARGWAPPVIVWGISRMYLLLFAILGHETFVADVGEEKAFVDGDVGGVLIGGGVGAPFFLL